MGHRCQDADSADCELNADQPEAARKCGPTAPAQKPLHPLIRSAAHCERLARVPPPPHLEHGVPLVVVVEAAQVELQHRGQRLKLEALDGVLQAVAVGAVLVVPRELLDLAVLVKRLVHVAAALGKGGGEAVGGQGRLLELGWQGQGARQAGEGSRQPRRRPNDPSRARNHPVSRAPTLTTSWMSMKDSRLVERTSTSLHSTYDSVCPSNR